MNTFNVEKLTKDIIEYIRDWFNIYDDSFKAIVGMSGGKDSTLVAKLLVEALGKNRVIGVALPQGSQSINEADRICEWLGISYMCINIKGACDAVKYSVGEEMNLSNQTIQNIPPRIRMTTLYAIAQSCNGMVINTSNLSENWIGYCTVYGDNTGALSPLGNITVTEIYQICDYLGIPQKWGHKIPDDGLPCSSSDEEKLGFTYEELDKYIRGFRSDAPEGYCHNNEAEELKVDKIDRLHEANEFKLKPVNTFKPIISRYYKHV